MKEWDVCEFCPFTDYVMETEHKVYCKIKQQYCSKNAICKCSTNELINQLRKEIKENVKNN